MKLLIKNSEWLRGTERALDFSGRLLHRGCYCVQGLYCKELGIPDEILDDEIRVSNIAITYGTINSQHPLRWLIFKGITMTCKPQIQVSEVAIEIEKINDDCDTTDDEKIELLRPIFADHGVEIEYREDL